MKFTETLNKNYEFRRLYAKGKSSANGLLAVYVRRTRRQGNRLGLTVSVKVGTAVTRNRVRRRLREIYRLREERMRTGLELIIVARSRAATAAYRDLERAFDDLCRRLDLYSDGAAQ